MSFQITKGPCCCGGGKCCPGRVWPSFLYVLFDNPNCQVLHGKTVEVGFPGSTIPHWIADPRPVIAGVFGVNWYTLDLTVWCGGPFPQYCGNDQVFLVHAVIYWHTSSYPPGLICSIHSTVYNPPCVSCNNDPISFTHTITSGTGSAGCEPIGCIGDLTVIVTE